VIRLALPLALLFTSSALAAETPQECTPIRDDTARLACFDFFFKGSGSASEAPTWIISRDASNFGGLNLSLRTISIEEITGPYGSGARAELTLRCEKGVTALGISFGRNFMSSLGNYGEVEYRVDDRPAETTTMVVSRDHASLGLWDEAVSVPFIKSLFGAERLLVRARPYSEDAVTAEFAIGGLENAAKPLREACGW
jgi:type VI secretion system protein VasI